MLLDAENVTSAINRLIGLNDRVETEGRTDERTRPIALPSPLTGTQHVTGRPLAMKNDDVNFSAPRTFRRLLGSTCKIDLFAQYYYDYNTRLTASSGTTWASQ